MSREYRVEVPAVMYVTVTASSEAAARGAGIAALKKFEGGYGVRELQETGHVTVGMTEEARRGEGVRVVDGPTKGMAELTPRLDHAGRAGGGRER